MLRVLQRLVLVALAGFFVSCAETDGPLEPIPGSPASLALVGTVVAPGGSPVADARVVLEPTTDGVTASVRRRLDGAVARDAASSRVTRSDADGRYRFDDVQAGPHLLTTEARDHLAALTQVTIPTLANAALDTIVVDVELTPTGSVQGVVELENEITFENTVVYLEGTSYVAVTDPAGAYVLDGVPVGSYDVVAVRDEFLDERTPVQISQAGEQANAALMVLSLDANAAPQASPAIVPRAVGSENIFIPTEFEPNAEDFDGTIVLWEWDFENDGKFDTADSTSGEASHQYKTPGSKRAKLRVTDDDGARTLAFTGAFEVFDGVYVSESTGDDANAGTQADPVATIQGGFLISGTDRRPLLVAAGTYAPFTPQSGIDVLGGLDPVTWELQERGYCEIAVSASGFVFNAIEDATYRRFSFAAADAFGPGEPSIGAALYDCPRSLVLEDCLFVGGNASDGGAGANGVAGGNGENGEPGQDAAPGGLGIGSDGRGAGGSSPGLGNGGRGGGGTTTNPLGVFEAAENGVAGGSTPAGAGGAGGVLSSPGSNCTNGGNGSDGITGSDGNGGSGFVTVTGEFGNISNLWFPAFGNDGEDGQDGTGGGGGAGSGGTADDSCPVYGAGGGGGGGGGQGGTKGEGGEGGGASIAVFFYQSDARLVDCALRTRAAGNGGPGGDSGLGGEGAFGAIGNINNGLQSGTGGDGGDGGDGGGGQGGPGGSVIGYVTYLSDPEVVNPTYTFGDAGVGGEGGLGRRFLLELRERAASGPDGGAFTSANLGN